MNASAKQKQSRWQCPSCDSGDQRVFFEIEDVPVFCNVLWHSKKEALECTKGKIRLAFCERCQLVHNLSYDPELLKYSQAYENSLHYSKRFQHYATKLARHLVDKYNLHKKLIVEIGCGKGEFLSMLCELGNNKGLGFDPSYDGDGIGNDSKRNVTLIRENFPQSNMQLHSDFICCRHTQEQLETLKAFLSAIRQSICNRNGTVVFFEVPNFLITLPDLAIWDIIYEHCLYFNSHSANALFQECGFEVLDIKVDYQGQFLCIEAVPTKEEATVLAQSYKQSPYSRQSRLNNATRNAGMKAQYPNVSQYVNQFARNYKRKREKWRAKLRQIASKRQSTIIWGTGSKGVTFLNVLNRECQIEYAVDINPKKQGKYVPGTGHKIIPPNLLLKYQPDVIIVMNPIYLDEIKTSIIEMGLSAQLMINDSNISSFKME